MYGNLYWYSLHIGKGIGPSLKGNRLIVLCLALNLRGNCNGRRSFGRCWACLLVGSLAWFGWNIYLWNCFMLYPSNYPRNTFDQSAFKPLPNIYTHFSSIIFSILFWKSRTISFHFPNCNWSPAFLHNTTLTAI